MRGSKIEYTKLPGFRDKLGQSVHVGDVIAYATEVYDTTYLKIGEVKEILYRETQSNRWSGERKGIRVKVQVPGQRVSMIRTPRNIVLVTKKESRVLGV